MAVTHKCTENHFQTFCCYLFSYSDANRAITSLEVSQYLENYLWPNFEPENANKSYLMSIAVMINEKFKEHVPPWKVSYMLCVNYVHVCTCVYMLVLRRRLENNLWSKNERRCTHVFINVALNLIGYINPAKLDYCLVTSTSILVAFSI